MYSVNDLYDLTPMKCVRGVVPEKSIWKIGAVVVKKHG